VSSFMHAHRPARSSGQTSSGDANWLPVTQRGDAVERGADVLADRAIATPSARRRRLRPSQSWTAGRAAGAGVVPSAGGRLLEPGVRAGMESSFGHDFSSVRVHSGDEASLMAQRMQARAYTVGHDVVLGPGEAVTGDAGRRLLAHELAHVVQQRGGGVGPAEAGVGAEQEADAAAAAITAGNGFAVRGQTGVTLARNGPVGQGAVIPPSPSRQAMMKELLDEHPGLHPKVADDAVNGAVRVMGSGGAGGDVVLDPQVTREVSVHSGRLDQQNLTTHLQAEARQAGVREIYLQVNSAGATTQSIRQTMNGIQNGVPELAGIRVRVYDSQGQLVWQGNMRFRDTDPIRSGGGGGGGGEISALEPRGGPSGTAPEPVTKVTPEVEVPGVGATPARATPTEPVEAAVTPGPAVSGTGMVVFTLVTLGAELVINHFAGKLAEQERENIRLGWKTGVVPDIEKMIESLHRGWRYNPQTRPTEQTYLVVVYGVTFEHQGRLSNFIRPGGVYLFQNMDYLRSHISTTPLNGRLEPPSDPSKDLVFPERQVFAVSIPIWPERPIATGGSGQRIPIATGGSGQRIPIATGGSGQ